MNRSELKSQLRSYLLQVAVLSLLMGLAIRLWGGDSLQEPSVVGCAFAFLFYIADGWVWYWVASCHKDYLPSFFTGTSACRFLLMLVIVALWYVLERGPMLTFLMVFLAYYLVMLAHHSIFFSRVSNRL